MGRYLPLLAVLLISSCSAIGESRDWDFVQSVGGIAVEQPIRDSDQWILPVKINVSGTQTITVKPVLLNSGLACEAVEAVVEDGVIYLTVTTRIAGAGRSAVCPFAELGRLGAGVYPVMYRSPDETAVRLGAALVGASGQQEK